MSVKFRTRASWALAAVLLGVAAVIGCSREEEAPEVDPSSPAAYMNDKAFMGKIAEQDKAKRGIMKRYHDLRQKRDALKAKSPDSPELKAMDDELKTLEKEFQANQAATRKIVRERLTKGKKKDK